MRLIQDQFDGRRLADALERNFLHETMQDQHVRLIQAASYFFIATTAGDWVDCSMKCGPPGFIHICGTNCIEYPEYSGNSMYRTAGNLLLNGNCGLLFASTDAGASKLRAMGKAIVLREPEIIARHPNAELVIRIECLFFPNCPAQSGARSDPETGPDGKVQFDHTAKSWKSLDVLADHLPGSV
jgi:Pyridoxamine 5'-phosphate oxidase